MKNIVTLQWKKLNRNYSCNQTIDEVNITSNRHIDRLYPDMVEKEGQGISAMSLDIPLVPYQLQLKKKVYFPQKIYF